MLNDFVGHRASTGHSFDSRMRVFVGDNHALSIARRECCAGHPEHAGRFPQGRALFQQWVKSSSHAKALRRIDYAFVSTGVIQRGDSIWSVQIFWSAPRQKGIFQ